MEGFLALSYLGAGALFIFSLSGLGSHETAKKGNLYGIIGIAVAIGTTLIALEDGMWSVLIPTLLIGGAVGSYVAHRIEMTAMPQLVAILHSFVGLAAVLVGIAGIALFHIERDFLPPFNEGAVQINVLMPAGTSLEKSKEVAEIAGARIREVPV